MSKAKLYKPYTVVGRFYSTLFSLPGWRLLAAAFVAVTVFAILLLGLSALPAILDAAYVIIVLLIYRRLNTSTVFWKNKRVFGLALATLVYVTIFMLVTRNAVISIASSTALLAVVILGLDGTLVTRYLVPITPPLLSLTTSSFLSVIPRSELLTGVSLVLLVAFLDAVVYLFMSRRKIGKYNLPDVGTLFLRNWLDKKTEIEDFFEEVGSYQSVNPKLIELPGLLLVHTDVHHGPFSNIGSSMLPEHLSHTLGRVFEGRVIALHGLGSHDRNIVSSRYLKEYIRSLEESLVMPAKKKLLYYGTFIAEKNDWRVMVIVFDALFLVLISRPVKGIDDIPYELQLEYAVKAKKLGLGDAILIDSHNWSLHGELQNAEVDKLRQLLDEVLLQVDKLKRKREPVEVLSRYTCFKAEAPGLIGGDCCLFCISGIGREEACVLYMRGNNIKPGVRNKLIEKLRALGTLYVEVITNDEHSETGTRAYIAYIPVHESEELLRAVKDAAKELAGKPYNKGAYYWECKVDLKLFGSAALELKKALRESLRESAALLLLYVFATPLVLMGLLWLVAP